jgi:hypothetical protein
MIAGDAGALPPISPSTPLVDLTAAQKGELCDWVNNSLGGYGHITYCDAAVPMENATSQAVCIAGMFFDPCPWITVGQYEACILAKLPSGGCDFPSAQCSPAIQRCPNGDH